MLMNRSEARLKAIEAANSRQTRRFERSFDKNGKAVCISEFFGSRTFSFDTMETKLPKNDVKALKDYAAIPDKPLPLELAEKVAVAVKEWAISKGATHYCHWFQPYTGETAEKHDSFFSFQAQGNNIEQFTGKQLIQSEPDASSFPSGGARVTFEARGYTGWDVSSPMFLVETDNGLTLCIPSVYISYSGEALDKKTPLLRSIHALNDRALEALRLLGDKTSSYVVATCGPEQEYFVIDKSLYALRPDLLLAKRTLLGRVPPRHQQMEDHYFGSIRSRILSFMMECEHELYKLGVPIKTRHNEVAPSQYEMAPTFEFANVAADHNQLTMEVLRSVARKHNLVVLFHEKPFSGINGSGKHVNWSMADSEGNNLLEPGDEPHQNVRFLYFMAAILKAIHDNDELLRCSVASAGNDFRLGANEAPPAIMSVFLGETLTAVLDQLEGKGNNIEATSRVINLAISNVPLITRDNTDRNRTSPFAFTGNKFEFRAVGASASISPSLTFLNTAVAGALEHMNTKLKEQCSGKQPSDDQILQLIRQVVKDSRKICFEGNNYSEEWHEEAARRGLPHHKTTPEALQVLKSEKARKLLSGMKVMSASELELRYNILIERYIKLRIIELETLKELVATHVLPAAYAQMAAMNEALDAMDEVKSQGQRELETEMKKLASYVAEMLVAKMDISSLLKRCKEAEHGEKVAGELAAEGMRVMEKCRDLSNRMEVLIDDNFWSLPKYREMLYIV